MVTSPQESSTLQEFSSPCPSDNPPLPPDSKPPPQLLKSSPQSQIFFHAPVARGGGVHCMCAVTKKENKYDLNINNSIIISSMDSVTLLSIEINSKLNFEKYVSTIISFCKFLSILLYIYLYIVNVFEYLFILFKNKESYLDYYYVKVLQFSLDPFCRLSSLPIC